MMVNKTEQKKVKIKIWDYNYVWMYHEQLPAQSCEEVNIGNYIGKNINITNTTVLPKEE